MERTRRDVLQSVGVTALGAGLGGVGAATATEGDSGHAQDCSYETVTPESEAGSFDLWYARADGAANLLEDTRTLFNNNYNHTLNTKELENYQFQAKLQSRIPSGEGPHLFEWYHDPAGKFWESSFLSNQRDDLRVDPCVYVDSAWDASRLDDGTDQEKVIGLPVSGETVSLIYNESMVDDPPQTLAEMTAIMEDHYEPESGTFGLGFPIYPYYISGFAQAYGEEIYDGEADELGITSDEVKKGLRVVLEDLKPYMPPDPGRLMQKSIFRNGNAPFTIDGPWQLPALEDTDFEVGVTTLPDLPDGGTPRPYMRVRLVYFGDEMNWDQRNGRAGREFAEWYTTNTNRLLRLANETELVPVHAEVADDERLPENTRGYAQQFETGYPMPANPKMNQVWGPFDNAITQAFNGEGTLDELLADAERAIRNDWADDSGTDEEGFRVTGDDPARDPDGDGLYEDVDGDGETTVFDTLSYFEHRDSDTIQDNPRAFDFDGDGQSGTVFDALELYNELS